MEHYNGWRLFQGKETKQVDGHTGHSAEPEGWYIEPDGYEMGVLYAGPYDTRLEAQDAILDLDYMYIAIAKKKGLEKLATSLRRKKHLSGPKKVVIAGKAQEKGIIIHELEKAAAYSKRIFGTELTPSTSKSAARC